MNKDYYKILQVSRTASPDEIKKAYRSLAKKYHPDVNPNKKKATEKFKEISEAYEVLMDQNKKSHFDAFGYTSDLFGAEGFQWNTFTRFSDVNDILDESTMKELSDIFDILLNKYDGENKWIKSIINLFKLGVKDAENKD